MVPDHSAFTFEFWAGLAARDPASFEQARRQLIDDLITAAPEAAKPRLRGLQWQVDRLRERHNPLSACVRISGMMWDRLLGATGLLDTVERLSKSANTSHAGARACKILPFVRPSQPGSRSPPLN
ncbi:MAG: DUF3135 domain-containing protein [Gammaproteobacteria bacterium]|nr:DUF3135 domain-containing protein [Gammaproteobacteria bacterium]